jgi:two-component system response regulator NreC
VSATGSSIRVVIVDDHNVVRSGIRMVLDADDSIDVVGEAASGEQAIRLLDDLFRDGSTPNVVVMDLMMEGIGGIEATRRITNGWPDLAVLILTATDDVAHLRDAFRAGAAGYVLKDAAAGELREAVRAVADGGRYLHPSLGAALVRAEEREKGGDHGVSLSAREVDVLRLFARGYSNKQIAEALFISVRTVETHKAHIMQKTGLRERSDLTRFAQDNGLG